MSEVLDNDIAYVDERSVSMLPAVLRYGLMGGMAIVIYKYINYTTLFATASLGNVVIAFLMNLALFGGLVYLVIKHHRDNELGGFITMGRCLGLGILTIVFASIMGGIFDYIYMSFVDAEILQKLNAQLTWVYEMMGMDEDQIEDTIELVEDTQGEIKPSLLMSVGGAAMGGVFTGLILSAIIGAFMRKNHPEAV
ncbi:MAG: DUF4199 domain-containing protein [Bacteroidota bacterium]